MPFNSLFSWIIKKRIHQIDLFKKYPLEVQDEVLMNVVERGKNTEWGREFDFESIQSYADFNKKVPLTNYEKLEPYVQRLLKNEQNLLWDADIKWFAKSSGTTSR